MLRFPLLLLLPLLSVTSWAQTCGPEQLDTLGEEVTDCVLRHQDSFHDTQDTFQEDIYIQEAACNTVTDILEECGGMWGSCYTDTEVKQLKSMQLSTLKETMGDHLDISSCSLEVEQVLDDQDVFGYGDDEAFEDDEDQEIPVDGCTDGSCDVEDQNDPEPPRSAGLLGRLLSVLSSGRK